ncbi:glycosyl hydrolase [Novipirellula artificiosorum]|nr:glycosyl hydrolase [Novipirellula artificiosorum]
MLSSTANAQHSASRSNALESGFLDPPRQAKPSAYWLWLNGYANRDYFDQELREFADKGVGGLCIFDMGGRGDADFLPPAGPAFMGEESVETIAKATEAARRHGLDVQLAAASSWDLGGPWVRPEHASMALYRTETRTEGPRQFNAALPFPELPTQVPRREDGEPAFYRDVAVLAVPETTRLPGHEFVFRLPRGDVHRIDHVVLYNAEADTPNQDGDTNCFSKDFTVAISTTRPKRSEFHQILAGSLLPNTQPQRFDFDVTDARYVRLTLLQGQHPTTDQVQLAEFEIYSTDGINIGGSKSTDSTRDPAELISYSSEAAAGGQWTAANLHDGDKSGPDGIWSFAGPPPIIIPDKSEIIDVTNLLSAEGRFSWSVPEGKWTIMRFVCANTGERLKIPSPNSDGLATDHFNADATRTFLQTMIDRLEKRLGNLSEAGIKQLYLPSYEVVGAKWTADFLNQFQRYRGYDMTRYLPVFAGCIVESEDNTERFLYDFEKTLGELLVDAYYRTASATARKAGLGIEAEAGGPGPPTHNVPVDALQALGAIDEMRGEFWPWRTQRNGLWVVKETACAAHVYGHRRVHMEAFTGFYHWASGPHFLKSSADRAFCEGMNHVVWHTASHQPPEAGQPGWVYGAGTHLTPNLIWWPMAAPFLNYLSRCSFLLQQGLFVGDVCYYYGDQGSNFVPPKHVIPSLGLGYDYDVASAEVVLSRMSVSNGRITLPDGMQYEILVLPNREEIDLAVLHKVEQLVRQGATIVGPKPIRTGGLTDHQRRDRQVKGLADEIWGACNGQSVTHVRYGKGHVYWGPSEREILLARNIPPDFQFVGEHDDCRLDYIHRRVPDADIYFVRNTKSEPARVRASFRVTGKAPEFWFPDSGEIRPCGVYQQDERVLHVPLSLDAKDSLFVVFRDRPPHPHLTVAAEGVEVLGTPGEPMRFISHQNGFYQFTKSDGQELSASVEGLPEAIELTQPWKLKFLSGRGAPESIDVEELQSWTDFNQQSIKYYSGIARYETSFNVPDSWMAEGRGIQLDLGNVWTVGRVRINGNAWSVRWKPPYSLDVSAWIQPGKNQLVVEVANTWSNRLVGDAQLPIEQRIGRTNITRSGTPGKPWKQVPLHVSGLMGPVRLVPTQETILP